MHHSSECSQGKKVIHNSEEKSRVVTFEFWQTVLEVSAMLWSLLA